MAPPVGPLGAPRLGVAGAVSVLLASVVAVVLTDPAGALAAASGAPGVSLSWWQAAVLGVVEGVTEYLPISSTGHLLIASRLLGLPDEQGSPGLEAVNTYAIAIQFGAIVAVAGLFWRRFRDMVLGLFGRSEAGRHLLVILVIAFVPSALLGFVFDDAIESALFGPWPIVAAWVIGGVVILVLERTGRIPSRRPVSVSAGSDSVAGVQASDDPTVDDDSARPPGRDPLLSITYQQALVVGLAQCLALWPGTSRSLATILGALLVGVSVVAAVEFSFLLGFATLTAASGYKLLTDGGTLVEQFGILTPLVGALFALVSAVLAIKWLVAYLERHDLTIFAWYRFVVAGLAVALLLTGVL
jgi:undecaprenyl-diphosphatase